MKYLIIGLLLVFGCKTKQPSPNLNSKEFTPDFSKGPPTIVYKTQDDYQELVPVLLSEDKSRIVSYPAKNDIFLKEEFSLPVALSNGYYLDNRGINENAAFLKLTYPQYWMLESLPSKAEMYEWILDKDPLITLCDCGNRKAFTDIESQLNALIESGKLNSVCHKIK